jgi:membrane protein involved in colicin uptake
MYTVKKIETPDRGEMFAVVTGENVENVINRFTNEEDAKENCTLLNGGEVAEKKLAAAEKKAEEDAKKVAEADQKSRAAAKPAAKNDDPKPRAHAAKAKAHVKRMTPRSLKEARPTRRHK